jgi:anti-sigma-K factor RskA
MFASGVPPVDVTLRRFALTLVGLAAVLVAAPAAAKERVKAELTTGIPLDAGTQLKGRDDDSRTWRYVLAASALAILATAVVFTRKRRRTSPL